MVRAAVPRRGPPGTFCVKDRDPLEWGKYVEGRFEYLRFGTGTCGRSTRRENDLVSWVRLGRAIVHSVNYITEKRSSSQEISDPKRLSLSDRGTDASFKKWSNQSRMTSLTRLSAVAVHPCALC